MSWCSNEVTSAWRAEFARGHLFLPAEKPRREISSKTFVTSVILRLQPRISSLGEGTFSSAHLRSRISRIHLIQDVLRNEHWLRLWPEQ